MGKKREIYYDILKTVCVCAVVLLHANATVVWEKDEPFILVIHNLINYLTRFSVPCFFMISGAFMMNQSKNMKEILETVIYKLLIPFMVMTVIWMCALLLNSKGKDLWNNVVKPLLICNYGALWFIPCICILYLLTPFFRSLVSLVQPPQYSTILIGYSIWTIFSVMVSDNYAPYSIGAIGMFVVYYLWGGYIYRLEVKKKSLIICFLLSIVLSIIALYVRIKGFSVYMFDAYKSYFSPAIFAMSMSVFLLCRYVVQMDRKVNIVIGKVSLLIARYSLYIYLLHRLIVILLVKIFEQYCCFNTIAFIMIVSVISLLSSLALGIIWGSIRDVLDSKLRIKVKIKAVVDSVM